MTNNTNFYTVHSSLWNIINYLRHRSQPLCQLIKIKILWNREHTQRAQITIDLGSCAVTQLVNIFHASESNIWGFLGGFSSSSLWSDLINNMAVSIRSTSPWCKEIIVIGWCKLQCSLDMVFKWGFSAQCTSWAISTFVKLFSNTCR